jgi:hypothetical protein
MTNQPFSLQPFLVSADPQAIASFVSSVKIIGSITRCLNTLTLRYELLDSLEDVVIPTPASQPERRDGLWQETCFEFFLGVKQSERYWEFNLSPAGHWNVYCFNAYRQGMKVELAFASLPFTVQHQSKALQLSLELDLAPIVEPDQSLDVAISAVIQPQEGGISYWALTHPLSQADFHQRDSFTIEL